MSSNSDPFEYSPAEIYSHQCPELCRSEQNCPDIIIKIGDERFLVHRHILEYWSPVLEALFSGNKAPDGVYELSNEMIDLKIMAELLSYLYTAKVTLTPDNVIALCRAAHYLELQALLSFCEDYASKIVSSRIPSRGFPAVFDWYLFADKHKLNVLQNSCVDHLRISCKNSEKALYESIISWIEHDRSGRSAHLPALLKCINYHELPFRFFDEVVAKQIMIACPDSCSYFVMKILYQMICKFQLYCFGLLPKSLCSSYAPNKLRGLQLDHFTGEWNALPILKYRFGGARYRFGGTVIKNQIFLCGGEYGFGSSAVLKTMEMFDCKARTWTPLADMPEGRYSCAAAALYGFVYVTGGMDSSRNPTSSVFRYNVPTDEWVQIESMKEKRHGHQLVELNERLYAINGWQTKTVEEYNPTLDEWRMVGSTRYRHDCRFGAISHDGKIYVCSGFGFEAYSPDSNTWNILTSPTPDNKFCAQTLVSLYGKLWSIGGANLWDDETKLLSTFDPSTGRWTQLPDLDVPRRNHCLFVAKP